MSKLPKKHKFIDLSDYGRPVARLIASSLKDTSFTPIDVTIAFIISGLLAILFMLKGYFVLAALFLILKSILDAADGELARLKDTPSYTGRYLDSIADIILNALFLATIWFISDSSLWMTLLAFVGVQLQGTLYNYYYVILRTRVNGDTTSRIFETETPVAFEGEKQSHVNIMFAMFKFLYGAFDRAIYLSDQQAMKGRIFPKWLMTCVSTLGLGFQLLIMAVMLVLGLKEYIISFFVWYTFTILIYVGIRRKFY